MRMLEFFGYSKIFFLFGQTSEMIQIILIDYFKLLFHTPL